MYYITGLIDASNRVKLENINDILNQFALSIIQAMFIVSYQLEKGKTSEDKYKFVKYCYHTCKNTHTPKYTQTQKIKQKLQNNMSSFTLLFPRITTDS